jgi:hypothetical protein
VLKRAFPAWDEHMTKFTYDKFKNVFDKTDMVAVEQRLADLRSNAPLPRITHVNRSITLRSIDSLDTRRNLESKFLAFDVVHCIGIVFSMFALPFFVGFDLEANVGLLLLEGFIVLESIVFVIVNILIYRRLENQLQGWLEVYYANGLVHDVLA